MRDLLGEVSEVVSNSATPLPEKLRALALCVVASDGIAAPQLERLMQIAGVPAAMQRAVYNLAMFGLDVTRSKHGEDLRPCCSRPRAHRHRCIVRSQEGRSTSSQAPVGV